MSFSLAAYKYKKILKDFGGPVKDITIVEKEVRKGEMGFEASAYLDDSVMTLPKEKKLIKKAHGVGTSHLKKMAVYRAFSEVLERWAYWQTISSHPDSCGFDVDHSYSGIAAFPGVTKFEAKKFSFFEAVERWALREWWQGNLRINEFRYKSELGLNGIEILTPFPGTKVAIIFRESGEYKFVSYGFAAHRTLTGAAQKAEIEEHRNYKLLEDFYKNREIPKDKILNLYERRFLYFSGPEGFNRFLNRARKTSNVVIRLKKPKLLVNEEIKGPWSKYTTVWRTLFQLSSDFYNPEELGFFYF